MPLFGFPIKETYIFGITYGSFPLIINGFSYEEIKTHESLKKLYKQKAKKTGKTMIQKWINIDFHAVNSISDINHIVFTDNIIESQRSSLDSLESFYGWKATAFLPKTKNNAELKILSRFP